MAMAFNERREADQPRPIKVLGERTAAQRAVPARSRAATARKLEEVATPEVVEETEEAEDQPAIKPRGRAAQLNATRVRENEEATKRQQEQLEMIEKLEAKRDELVDRLDKGAARIEDARQKGKDVQEWEDYWIQLLRQYEQICDRLRELARA